MTPYAISLAHKLLIQLEGFCSEPYRDTAGKWSIGYGFRYQTDGTHVTRACKPMDRTAADSILIDRIHAVADTVEDAVRPALTDCQYAALISFTYNVGGSAFRGSSVLRFLNNGGMQEAADGLLAWDHAEDAVTHRLVVVPGLLRRRKMERAVFLGLEAEKTTDQLNAAELGRIAAGQA